MERASERRCERGERDSAERDLLLPCSPCSLSRPLLHRCPACSSGKSRFKRFSGNVPSGNPNSGAALKARLADLSGGSPRTARAAPGVGVDKGDSGALVGGLAAAVAVAAGLYAFLNASF